MFPHFSSLQTLLDPPPPRPPPALMPELVEEILLRVPPDDPATLIRAALVCKPWCRVVASAHFRRRLRDLRRGHAAPLLGFLCDLRARGGSESFAQFVPMAPSSSFRPPRAADFPDMRAHDARHGRVLLHTYPYGCGHPYFAFLVWDPATDERREIPRPPRYPDSWKATVLCTATTAGGACDHVEHPLQIMEQELVHQVKDALAQAATFSVKANSCCYKRSRGGGRLLH